MKGCKWGIVKMAAMAVVAGEDEFDTWLGVKLRDLNTDEGIFGSYIKSILNGDESADEKVEALEGILSEITVRNLSTECTKSSFPSILKSLTSGVL